MRILITGGAGFIGSHLSETLLAAGHHVAVVDNTMVHSFPAADRNPQGRLTRYRTSILQTVPLQRAFDTFEPDAVYHLAAQHSVPHSLREPRFDAETNIVGTINVLEQCRRLRVERVIYTASGGTCYGERRSVSREDTPLAPVSPYGISKAAAESYVRCFSEVTAIPAVSLRLANVYGPRQFSQGESNVIAIFLRRLCQGQPLTICGDGEQTRDFLHVDDAVRALSAVLTADVDHHFTPLNTGSGIPSTVNQIAALTSTAFREWQIACGATPCDVPVTRFDPRPGELRHCTLNCDRIRSLTGWAAEVDLARGIDETAQWFASRLTVEDLPSSARTH